MDMIKLLQIGRMLLGPLALGYLLGSFPTGFCVARWWGKIDIREHGSGSMGATNILRTLGRIPAGLVLLIDLLKGAAAVVLASFLEWPSGVVWDPWDPWDPGWLVVVASLGAIVGHSRPVWVRFRGGKSVATSLGVLLAMAWPVAFVVTGIWLLALGFSQIVSVSSITAAVSLSVVMTSFGQPYPYRIFAIATGLFVLFSHRRNLDRLQEGTEPKIGQKVPVDD